MDSASFVDLWKTIFELIYLMVQIQTIKEDEEIFCQAYL
jgi:hypothetical protein